MYTIKYGTFEFDEHYIFNDIDLTGLPIRTSSQVITGRDGSIIWKQLYSSRTITIGGYIIGSSASDYYEAWRDMISAFAISDSSVILEITLPNNEIRYIECKTLSLPTIAEEEGQIYTGAFQVILQAENPYYRDAFATSTLYASSASGFPVATTVPTPLGGISLNTVNVSITGEYGSYPSYIIHPTITNPRISNQSTGESFQIEMDVTLATGSIYVSFDQYGKHVGTSTSPNMYNQYFTGTYFRLQKGNNNIVFTGADVSNASLELTYANNYISV